MEKNADQALLASARKILPGRISGQQEAVAHEAALEWEWVVDGPNETLIFETVAAFRPA